MENLEYSIFFVALKSMLANRGSWGNYSVYSFLGTPESYTHQHR